MYYWGQHHIQSEFLKIRIKKNSEYVHFSRSETQACQIFLKMYITYRLIHNSLLLMFVNMIIIFRYWNISGCKDIPKLKSLSDKIFCDLNWSVWFNLESYLKNHLKWWFSTFSRIWIWIFSLKKRIKSKKTFYRDMSSKNKMQQLTFSLNIVL